MNAPFRVIPRPHFSQALEGEGGIFAGVMRGENGQPDYLLIVHPEKAKAAPWQAQMDWAKNLQADGHKDYRLPTRREQRQLFANAKDLFEEAWYWSCETHAEYPSYAWLQGFSSGSQSYYREGYTFRARAVRSVILQ